MRFFRNRPLPAPDVTMERHPGPDSEWQPDDADFKRTIESRELANGQTEIIEIRGIGIVITRFDGKIRAFLDVCPHWGGSFLQDPVSGAQVQCPWHRWTWSLATGEMEWPHRSGKYPLRWIPARERSGWIEVAIPPATEPTDTGARPPADD